MATGKVVTGHFYPIQMSGSLSNIASHTSGSCLIQNTSITIDGVSKGTWTTGLYHDDYLFIPRYINTGHQNFLLQALYPNNDSGKAAIVVWNCNDAKLSATFNINGFLIPRSLCQSSADATLYKQYIFKEYGVSSSVSVPGAARELEVTAGSFSYSVPSNYRVFGLLDFKSGNANCSVVRFEPYVSGSTSTVMKLYNFTSSNQSATPTFRVIFVKSNFITYV